MHITGKMKVSRGLFITRREQQDANVVSDNQVSESGGAGEMKSHPEKTPRDLRCLHENHIFSFLLSQCCRLLLKTLVVLYLALLPSI